MENDPVPALLKALGQLYLIWEWEWPVPVLLKALGQVPPFPYGEKRWDRSLHSHMENDPVPALLKALGQGQPIPEL